MIVAVPINALGAIEFIPELSEPKRRAIAIGQASRGIKIFIHARGDALLQNSIRPGHPFGYLATESLRDDGTQLLIGFGPDAERCDAADLAGVQRQLHEILPGYEVIDADRARLAGGPVLPRHLGDPPARLVRAPPRGPCSSPRAAMILAGADIANGWAGFIDGAIESGLRAGARAALISA